MASVPVMDNAGVFVRLIDRSQVAADLSPNALYGAFAVDSERGFINRIYRLTNGIYDRLRFFGRKNWRKYGYSLHDLDKYLESNQPAFAIRAGSSLSEMAGMSLSVNPGQGGYGLIDQRGKMVSDQILVGSSTNQMVKVNQVSSENPLDGSNYFQLTFTKFILHDGDYFSVPNPSYDSSDPSSEKFLQYKWLKENAKVEADDGLGNIKTSLDLSSLGFVNNKCTPMSLPSEDFEVTEPSSSGSTTLISFLKSDDASTASSIDDINSISLTTLTDRTASSSYLTFSSVGEVFSFNIDSVITSYTVSKLPDGYFNTMRWEENDKPKGRTQALLGPKLADFNNNPSILCDIFARGEGEWGNSLTLTISQRAFEKRNPPFDGSVGDVQTVKLWSRFAEPVLFNETTDDPNDRYYPQWTDNSIGVQGMTCYRASSFDGPRIFSLSISDGVNPAESYADVSFNPTDVNGSGVSIYIENVLAGSGNVAIFVNGEQSAIDLSNIHILPSRPAGIATDPDAIAYNQSIRLQGGSLYTATATNDPYAFPAYSPVPNTKRGEVFAANLQKIFDNYITYDAYLAFNAGQEIDNPKFDSMVNDFGRVLGLTACPRGEAFMQDQDPIPGGGVTGRFTAKYNQWIAGIESESGQEIYTSPIGWVGKIIGQNAIAGMLPYAPAGYRRGIIAGARGISRTWSAKQRLAVVAQQWNPIKDDPVGLVIWDALTAQTIKSALSNIHVILSYLAMLRGIENTLRGFEFEFNDESTVATILNLLRGMADGYIAQQYAEQIIVDAQDNTYGTDQIRIRWNVRFKEVARTIVVDVIAYPSSQDLSISMAG